MKLIRIVLSVALVAVVATSAFAFMAQNSVASSMAGEGSGTVYGYTVTGISYDISPSDPSWVVGVSFDLNAPAKTVFVRYEPGPEFLGVGLISGACHVVGTTNHWDCGLTLPGIKLEALNELEVMAAQ